MRIQVAMITETGKISKWIMNNNHIKNISDLKSELIDFYHPITNWIKLPKFTYTELLDE